MSQEVVMEVFLSPKRALGQGGRPTVCIKKDAVDHTECAPEEQDRDVF